MADRMEAGKRRILIVDDNPDIFQDFRAILLGVVDTSSLDEFGAELFGKEAQPVLPRQRYHLDYAPQGREGVDMAARALEEGLPHQLAFIDMRMPPGWDGLETIEHLWQVNPDVQVVICTAYSDRSWEEITARLGSTDKLLILKKPFDSTEVSQLALALTEKWRLGRQAALKMEELDHLVAERTQALDQANTRLRESDARTRLALDISKAVVWEWDIITDALVLEACIQEILNCETREFPSSRERFLDLCDPTQIEEIQASMAAHLRGETPVHLIEYRVRTGDGDWRWVLSQGRIVDRNAAGEPLRVIGTFIDVTERKKAEEEHRRFEAHLLEMQRMESLRMMAGAVAHNFNNALMAVLGRHELAIKQLLPASPALEHVQEAEKAAQRAAELSALMLTYVGQGKESVERLDLAAIASEVCGTLEGTFPEGVSVDFFPSAGLPSVEGDLDQIRQVLVNLLSNALEAMDGRGGKVTVDLGVQECDADYLRQTLLGDECEEGVYVWLEVSDNGTGMDHDTVARIFDPFFTTKFTGRGLGLAAVLGIIRGHRGTVNVYTELDLGTAVKVLLPARERRDKIRRHETIEDLTWRSSGRILVIDDEEAVLSVDRRVLENFGFDVVTCENGQEGIERFKQAPDGFRCVLLDVGMTGLSGVEVLVELRRIRRDTPIIISSGFPLRKLQELFEGKDVQALLEKPHQSMELARELRRVLGEDSPSKG